VDHFATVVFFVFWYLLAKTYSTCTFRTKAMKLIRLLWDGLLQMAKLSPLYIMWSVVSLLLAGVIIAADDGFPGPHNEHVNRHKHGSI